MTVELLSCPFCGESSFCRVLPYQFPPDADGPAWKWGYHVVCDASGIEGTRKGCGCSSAWGETEAEAIAAWNRRSVVEGRETGLEEAAKWLDSRSAEIEAIIATDHAAGEGIGLGYGDCVRAIGIYKGSAFHIRTLKDNTPLPASPSSASADQGGE